jgi:hypothetical protein
MKPPIARELTIATGEYPQVIKSPSRSLELPVAGSCSLAITAACHPAFDPNEDKSTVGQWGRGLKRFETKPREAEEHEASNCERTDYRDGRVPTGNLMTCPSVSKL